MANTSQIQLSSLDFDSIKQSLITYLQSQSQFQDYNFQGSALNILLDVLSYNTFYNAFYMNMIANEMFLDTAIMRSSVVSQAKALGYTSRSAASARATLNVAITRAVSDSTTSLYLPRFTQFAAQSLNGKSFAFYTTDDSPYVSNVSVGSANTFTFNYLNVNEGTPVTKQFGVNNTTNPSQTFDLVDSNIDLSTLKVTVQNSLTSPVLTIYNLAQDATQVSANSNVYYVEEGNNLNYLIYFGDGVLGRQLPDQSIITVSYLVTDSDLANGLGTFFLQTSILNGSTSNVTTSSASAGGAQQESIDSIKFSAPKSFIAQNRIVTKNDYITQINKNYPYFDAVAVWGGEDQSPPIYGKVYISAKPKNGYTVTLDQQNYLINDILKPLSVLTVSANYVPADYDFLNFNIGFTYDPTQTNLSQNQLSTLIANSVATFCNTNLNTFNSSFAYSKFLGAIDGTDPSIQSSSATIYLQKQFYPLIGQSGSYVLNFGTPLHQGITNDRLYSSPYFESLDAAGNSQQCYFEETPFGYGAIGSVTIQSPGYNYISAPKILIEGDGLGANAYPVIVNGQINSVVVDVPGNNYTTAVITMVGGGGQAGVLVPVISGSKGTIRTYYFDTNNVKQILNPNAGTIDYLSGIVNLDNLYITNVGGPQEVLSVFAQPYNSNFVSKNEIILTYNQNDSTALSITPSMIST